MSAPFWTDQPQHSSGGTHHWLLYTDADGNLIVYSVEEINVPPGYKVSYKFIEHESTNTTVIKAADWILDLGPDGGAAGGQLVFEGTPAELAQRPDLATGAALQ